MDRITLEPYRITIEEEENILVTTQREFTCNKKGCKARIFAPPFFVCKVEDVAYCENCIKKGCNYSGIIDEHIDFCIRRIERYDDD